MKVLIDFTQAYGLRDLGFLMSQNPYPFPNDHCIFLNLQYRISLSFISVVYLTFLSSSILSVRARRLRFNDKKVSSNEKIEFELSDQSQTRKQSNCLTPIYTRATSKTKGLINLCQLSGYDILNPTKLPLYI